METIKTIAGGILLVGLMGVTVHQLDNIREIFAGESEVILNTATTTAVSVEEEPQYPSEWQNEAQEAYEAVIRRKTLEKEKESLEAIVSSTSKRIDEIDKELGLYWRERENLKKLIIETFPERPRTALGIVACESGFRTDIQSHHILDYGREQSFGLFQIHAKVWHDTAVELGLYDYKTDPEQNAQMARYIYEQAGHSFSPWTCYSKKMHLAHL